MDASKDAALVKEYLGGNKEAFGFLYESYIKPIYNFVYFKTFHKETAEDITSRVFIKAYTALQSYQEDKGSFSAWLYSIARNAVIDHYRSQHATLDIEDVWDLQGDVDIPRDTDARLSLEKVQSYLKDLPSQQRELVLMRVWQELTYEEIASITGKSEASCKMMYSRTIKKLREQMPVAVFALFLLGHIFLKK